MYTLNYMYLSYILYLCVYSMYIYTYLQLPHATCLPFCLLVVGEQTKQSKTRGAPFVWKKTPPTGCFENLPISDDDGFCVLRMAPCPKPFGWDAFFTHGDFRRPSAVPDGCGTAARGGNPRVESLGRICKTTGSFGRKIWWWVTSIFLI